MNKNPLRKKSIFTILKKIVKPKLGCEKILLEKSVGRFLDEKIVSKIDLPPFTNSAVDGYALLKDDILNKKKYLTSSIRIAAGGNKNKILKKGEVARIFTGAKMPKNSQTVIMQENTDNSKGVIKINKFPLYGDNCRLQGEDIAKGNEILFSGDKINNSNINLIAAIGKKNVLVKKKINIGFYTSGNELTEPTENLKGSKINNSNYFSLNALLNKPFIYKKYLGTLKDDEDRITNSIKKNIKKYSVIITTGGASVGEEDYLINVIKKLGKVYFWKTAIKPGRPLAVGKINETIIICLPGNPVSVHLLYGMIIYPFLEYLCSGNFIEPNSVIARTDFKMKKKNKRLEWLRVCIKKKKKELIVTKFSKQGSGMISSIVYADGILEIPENVKIISKNDNFKFFSFKNLFD